MSTVLTRKITTPLAGSPGAATEPAATVTRALLACGIVAGPLYILVGAIEILTRDGFDMTRHDLSLMSNGDLGWIHITLLVLTGLLTVASAAGMRRAVRGGGGTWGPLLVGFYGWGLIGAGVFVADPAFGFPPGTPADANAVSWHGLLHVITGGVGFLALIAACFVFARRFRARKQWGWATYSMTTGAVYFVAFFGIASGSQRGGAVLTFVILAFTVAVVLGWAWLSVMAARLMKGGAA